MRSTLSPRAKRFHRVAGRRTNHVLDALTMLERCSRREYYKYGQQDVDLIFQAIERRVADCKTRFCTHDPICFSLREGAKHAR